MMRGASGDECGNLVLGQEYNRPAEAGVLKKPRGSDFNFFNFEYKKQKIIISSGTPFYMCFSFKNNTFPEWSFWHAVYCCNCDRKLTVIVN
jgi:hypothetical protein